MGRQTVPPLRGATDQSIIIFLADQSAPDVGKTGVVPGSVTLKTLRIDANGRPLAALSAARTLSALGSVTAAHIDDGWIEIGDGFYRYDLPDSLIGAGAASLTLILSGADIFVTPIDVPLPLFDVLGAPPTTAELADALLGRNVAGGSNGGRTVARALQSGLVNRIEITGSGSTRTLTMFGTDDATPLYQTTLSGVGTLGFTQSDPV